MLGTLAGQTLALLVKTGTLRETEPTTVSDLLERPGQLAFNLHRQINYVANHGAHPDKPRKGCTDADGYPSPKFARLKGITVYESLSD